VNKKTASIYRLIDTFIAFFIQLPETKHMKKTRFTVTQAQEGFFLNVASRGLSESTKRDYENTTNKFIAYVGAEKPIDMVTVHDIEGFLAANNHLSKKTLLNYHTGLSAMWNWALGEKLVTENIVRSLTPPKPEIREIVPFTENELKLMLSSLEKSRPYKRSGKKISDHSIPGADRNRAMILLLVDTGLRASELCSILIKDVDTRNHRILVMGKGTKERMVQYSARTGQAIWRYLASRADARPTDPLFTTLDGHALGKDRLARILDAIGGRAKITNVHPHRFRHTFAIQFLRNGGDPFTLQMLLGHSTLDMVKRYLHIAQAG
jgi:site-specific recombinase XerD